MRRAAGFTLVEILVVITIIGLLGSLATFSFSGNEQRVLKNKAEQISDKIRAAADLAVFNNMEIGMVLGKKNYQFTYFNLRSGNWEALKKDGLESGELDDETFSLNVDNAPVTLPDKTGELNPSIVLLSSGEISQFALKLSSNDVKTTYAISTDGADINVEAK